MSDLSDPTALPDDVREAAKHALDVFNARRDDEIIDALAPVLAAHFAAEAVRESHGRELHHFETEVENEGLRAQIEEARAHVAKIDIIMYETGSASVGKLEDILAQSPRGTVARIQAGAWAEGYSHCFECPEPGTSLDDNPYTNPFASSGDTTNRDK